MTDYFEEMNCQPVNTENVSEHQLMLLVRFLQENVDFIEIPGAEDLGPPASKELVANLKETKLTATDEKCAVCLKPNIEDLDAIFKILPCGHKFHSTCIMPWLEKTNSCPLCRFEMKTDDVAYEVRKKFLLRAAQRDEELETLHGSMFG